MSSNGHPMGLSNTQQKKLRREAKSLAREGKGVVRNGEFRSNEWEISHDVWRHVVRVCNFETLRRLRCVNSFFQKLLKSVIIYRNNRGHICRVIINDVNFDPIRDEIKSFCRSIYKRKVDGSVQDWDIKIENVNFYHWSVTKREEFPCKKCLGLHTLRTEYYTEGKSGTIKGCYNCFRQGNFDD